MPVYLPPIPRREFLRRSLLAGAGLLTAPRLLSAGEAVDPHAWALLADTHIAANPGEVRRGIVMARHFEQVSTEILALRQPPAGALIAGDLALNSGELCDYTTLRRLLTPLRAGPGSLHLALGNHDHRGHFLAAFPETTIRERPLATHVVAVVRAARANWFLLDSLEKTLATPGWLGETQLAWLARALDANARKPAIVVLHHNLDASSSGALKDTPALLEVLRPRRQVKACVFGHTHVWKHWTDESGIHLINLPPVAYVFREGEPSGWVQATLESRAMTLELRCVDPSHSRHGEKVRLDWRGA
jgi:3',5'-cyclic AMP phosphodiesterase CpdA